MNKKMLLMLTIIFMVIGFASVSTYFYLNGYVTISTNDDFDVFFNQASINSLIVSRDVISSDKKSIDFKTTELTKVGDTNKLEYKIVNNSTQYDANVSINCTSDENKYISFSYTPTEMFIYAGTYGNGKITITLNNQSIDDKEINFHCELKAKALSKNKKTNKLVDKNTNYDVIVLGDSIMSGYRNNYKSVDYYLIEDNYGSSSLNLSTNSATLFYSEYVNQEQLIYEYQLNAKLYENHLYIDDNATIIMDGGINDILYNLKYANYNLGISSSDDLNSSTYFKDIMKTDNLISRIYNSLYGIHATFNSANLFYILPRKIPETSTKEYYVSIEELNNTIELYNNAVKKWANIMHYDNVIIIDPNEFVLESDLYYTVNSNDNVHWKESAYIKLKNIIEEKLNE